MTRRLNNPNLHQSYAIPNAMPSLHVRQLFTPSNCRPAFQSKISASKKQRYQSVPGIATRSPVHAGKKIDPSSLELDSPLASPLLLPRLHPFRPSPSPVVLVVAHIRLRPVWPGTWWTDSTSSSHCRPRDRRGRGQVHGLSLLCRRHGRWRHDDGCSRRRDVVLMHR